MKKVTIITFMLAFITMIISAQPIKVQLVSSFFQGYTPDRPPCPQLIAVNTVKAPTKKYIAPKVVEPKIVIDTLQPIYDIDTTIVNVNINVPPIDLGDVIYELKHTEAKQPDYNKLLFASHTYRERGVTKIISGLGLQVVATGLMVFANTDIHDNMIVERDYTLPYSYTEYELKQIPDPKTVKCIPVPPPVPDIIVEQTVNIYNTINVENPIYYQLNAIQKTGSIQLKTEDTVMRTQSRDKTPYYIGAGVLALAGTVLEVSGIIDLHRANLIATRHSVGVCFNF